MRLHSRPAGGSPHLDGCQVFCHVHGQACRGPGSRRVMGRCSAAAQRHRRLRAMRTRQPSRAGSRAAATPAGRAASTACLLTRHCALGARDALLCEVAHPVAALHRWSGMRSGLAILTRSELMLSWLAAAGVTAVLCPLAGVHNNTFSLTQQLFHQLPAPTCHSSSA